MNPLEKAWAVLKGTERAGAPGGRYGSDSAWQTSDVTQIDPNIVSMWLRHKFPGDRRFQALDPAGEEAQRMARQAFQAHPTANISHEAQEREDEARDRHLVNQQGRRPSDVSAFRDWGGAATGKYEPRDPNLGQNNLDHQGYDVHYADDRMDSAYDRHGNRRSLGDIFG